MQAQLIVTIHTEFVRLILPLLSSLPNGHCIVRIKVFVREDQDASTADSYHSLGVTQHSLGDFTSALQSAKRALQVRIKVFGEDHASTADSYSIHSG